MPDQVLQPRTTWADGAAYDAQAGDLARRFTENFRQFAGQVAPEVAAAGPRALGRLRLSVSGLNGCATAIHHHGDPVDKAGCR